MLRRLYPVRTFFVKEIMKIDLDYINFVLINDKAQSYPEMPYKKSGI
jgi:hypothetical protein